MKTKYSRHIRIRFIKISLFAATVAAFFLPSYTPFESKGDNYFAVSVNGEYVGTVGGLDDLDGYVRSARKKIASETDDLVFMDSDITTEGSEVLWGEVTSKETMMENIEKVLRGSIKTTMAHGYTVKVNEYSVNLTSIDEVHDMLQACLDKYQDKKDFNVELVHDSGREFNVLTSIVNKGKVDREITYDVDAKGRRDGGICEVIDTMFENIEPAREKTWNEFEYGLVDMGFAEKVEVVESYLPASQFTPLEDAIVEVTKEQEKDTIYEVQPGDTLSGISLTTGIPVDRIIELNKTLDNEYSILHIGDELKITVPEPEISVRRLVQEYVEESYDAPIEIIPVDDWYTTQTEVLQQPSAGFRKAVAVISYTNENEDTREVIKEETVIESIPKIMKQGTKIPPTYVKPIAGGTLSSRFGRRNSPTRGASSYHEGVDWSTPVGTPVYASSTGVVSKAGWGSGYGYCVFIDHPDGRQTRYAHLSKVLVSVGQSVTQNERIASSGNTGISTGPHLHFEIRIGGRAVNPLDYLN